MHASVLSIVVIAISACGSPTLVERARMTGAMAPPSTAVEAVASTAPDAAPAAGPAVVGAPDPAIFKDCAGRRVDPANEFIGCPAFIASAHRPVGFAVDAALDTLVQDAKHGAYGDTDARTVTVEPYRFALDGAALTGRRYTVTRAAGATDHHVAAALEGRGGKLLIAHCQTNGQLGHPAENIDDVCPTAMATILTGQVPADIYMAKAPYADGTVVGEAVLTPDGCERDGDEQRIRCGEGGQLSWYQAGTSIVPLAVVAQAKTQAITSSATTEGVTLAEPVAIQCTVAGQKTTCVHHRLDIEGEPAVHFYQARVDVRGDTLYAVCSGAGAAPDKPAPMPCDQVFDW